MTIKATNPILSKIPADTVMDAHRQMLRIAPELRNEKEPTCAFLRQAFASQNKDTDEAKHLATISKTGRKKKSSKPKKPAKYLTSIGRPNRKPKSS